MATVIRTVADTDPDERMGRFYTARLASAAECWRRRNDTEGHRRERPAGRFDHLMRWWPNAGEVDECCDAIKLPSRRHPFALLRHCKGYIHIATRYGVEPVDLWAVLEGMYHVGD